MPDIQMIIPPLAGAIIGYVTNGIAIKMLFHPRKPVFIGRWQLPFTPGLIPKEQKRVAKAIGRVVSTEILSPDTMTAALTCPEVTEHLRGSLEKIVAKQRENSETIGDALLHFGSPQIVDETVAQMKDKFREMICHKLENMQFGQAVAQYLLEKFKQSLGGSVNFRLFGLIDDNLLNDLAEQIAALLDKAFKDHAGEIVATLVDKEVEKLLHCEIGSLVQQYEHKIPVIIDLILSAYTDIIEKNMEQILKGLDLEKVVEEKVASMEVSQLERLIFGMIQKELNAIVYFGALLGFLMGWVNLLFLGA